MLIVISSSVIAVILTYLSSFETDKKSRLFQLAFWLITFLQVVHYDYGKDYMSYLYEHLLISGKQISDLVFLYKAGNGAFKDVGWVVLNYILPGKIGFFVLVAVVSIVQNIIYFNFIKDNVAVQQRWISVAIYLFTASFYLQNFSGLRQGLAVSLTVLSVMLANKNKFLLSIIVCTITCTIHASAIITLPFLLLTRLDLVKGRKYGLVLASTFLVLFFGTTIVGNIFENIMSAVPIFSRNYGHYAEDMAASGMSLGFGFLLNSFMYMIILYFMLFRFDEISHSHKVFMILTCVSLCILPFQMNISGLISRVSNYFSVYQIVVVPLLYHKIRNRIARLGFGFVYAFMMFYQYYQFLFVTTWSAESYRVFHTIFSELF